MPAIDRLLIRRAVKVASLVVILAAPAAAQQAPVPSQSSDADPGFLTRYNFHLAAAGLANSDPRFSWDTHFGGDLDVVDYGFGRAGILVDYEAVLGSQLRPFDPNQGNYTLETSASLRFGKTEVAGVFHHVSRHLGDRPKVFAIAWNVAGVRAFQHLTYAGVTADLEVEGGHVTQHSYVDYTWTGGADLVIRRALTPMVGVFAHGNGQLFGVDNAVANRSQQSGGLAEVGLRLNGRAGAIELFAGVEQRVDAYPLDRVSERWALAGFRLLSR